MQIYIEYIQYIDFMSMPNCQFASYRLLGCEFVINSVFMCIDVCLKQFCLLYYVLVQGNIF